MQSCQSIRMKKTLTVASSVAGLLALLFMANLFYLHVFGLRLQQFPRNSIVILAVFWGGLALSSLALVLAASCLPRRWRSGGVIGRFIWCCAVMAGFYLLVSHGP